MWSKTALRVALASVMVGLVVGCAHLGGGKRESRRAGRASAHDKNIRETPFGKGRVVKLIAPTRPAAKAPAAPQTSEKPKTEAPNPPPSPMAERSWTTEPVSQFIFFAVLEGLYDDGVSNEVVDEVIPTLPSTKQADLTLNFIYLCPLCQPALEAFRVYKRRRRFLGFRGAAPNTFATKLSESLKEQLGSPALNQRQDAMKQLIERWVRRRMDEFRLSDAERAQWKIKFEEARATAMGLLKLYQEKKLFGNAYADWSRCPVCDGAIAACSSQEPAPTE